MIWIHILLMIIAAGLWVVTGSYDSAALLVILFVIIIAQLSDQI